MMSISIHQKSLCQITICSSMTRLLKVNALMMQLQYDTILISHRHHPPSTIPIILHHHPLHLTYITLHRSGLETSLSVDAAESAAQSGLQPRAVLSQRCAFI